MPTNDPTAPRERPNLLDWLADRARNREAPAVLPEEGTTPPTDNFSHLNSEGRRVKNRPVAGSLRETGAGRGEATEDEIHKELGPVDYPQFAEDMAGVLSHCLDTKDDVRLRREAHHAILALYGTASVARKALAASPEGGAPTEELTQKEREALGAVLACPDMTMVTPEERALAWKVYLRLTRSPRAAGEPT